MSDITPIHSAQTTLPVLLLPPALPEATIPAINEFIKILNVPRNIIASDEEILYAWRDLPRELKGIPGLELYAPFLIKMCLVASVGTFDAAINYAWNASILSLRDKVKNFGLPIVAQILQEDFEEKHLLALQDSKLLELCLDLNLITEDGYFFLDQCRSIRNNFSAAHPTIGQIGDREFINFLSRCVKYALAETSSPRGVDIVAFIEAIKKLRFSNDQKLLWLQRLNETYDAQRETLFGMIHGIYCDPSTLEATRLNIIDLCIGYKDKFTSNIKSIIINRHSEYLAKGDTQRHLISQQFFEKIESTSLLDEHERHRIISKAINQLWSVHQSWNNFHNESPFAERLAELSKQGQLPSTIQEEFVTKVIGCYIGNEHGFSWNAEKFYEDMIQDFSPKEIQHMIKIPLKSSCLVANRINTNHLRRKRFQKALQLINIASVPKDSRVHYENFVGKQANK